MERGYGIFDTGATGWTNQQVTEDDFGPSGLLDPGGRKLLSHGGDTEASLLGVGPSQQRLSEVYLQRLFTYDLHSQTRDPIGWFPRLQVMLSYSFDA